MVRCGEIVLCAAAVVDSPLNDVLELPYISSVIQFFISTYQNHIQFSRDFCK